MEPEQFRGGRLRAMIPRSVEISTQIVSHGCNAMAGEVFALQPRSWQSTQRQPPSIYSERRCADILSSSSFSPSISCCRIVAFLPSGFRFLLMPSTTVFTGVITAFYALLRYIDLFFAIFRRNQGDIESGLPQNKVAASGSQETESSSFYCRGIDDSIVWSGPYGEWTVLD